MTRSLNKVGKYGFAITQFWLRFVVVRTVFSWWLSNMSGYLPVDKISETETLLCFYHPRPSHALHILLIPKKDIQNLTQLNRDDNEFILDLFETVRLLIREFGLEKRGFRLIANGGKYQEFPQLHFHLIADE